jgi:ubiquinone/menaquinone biosynthesis C-methylase UbiE
VGAGTGFLAAALAPLVKRVHVLDGSSAMLEVARRNLAGFDNVEFHLADGLSLPLPDASVDEALANMYLHHCPDPLAAIREMVRILRPAGRLVITDLDIHTNEWLKAEMADVWLGFPREQIRRWFEQAGLVNVIVDCTGQACQSESRTRLGERAEISIFVTAGTKRIRVHDSVQASYSARALEKSCGCGDSSCCGPSSRSTEEIGSGTAGFYSPSEKAEIPAEAATFSLGCGNPIAMAELRTGETVLDIGSGGGIDVFLAAKRVGPAGFVYGIDMTPTMLERARQSAQAGGYANVRFEQGYAEKLPMGDGSVDVVLSNCVINLSEDKGQVFREAYRVLRDGGRLEVSDMVFAGPVLPEARYSSDGWSRCFSGALPENEYVDLIREAGFHAITVRRSTDVGSPADVAIYSVQVSAKK